MNADNMDAKFASKIGNLLQLFCTGKPSLARHQADGALHRRNIGIAFAFKAGEDTGDLDTEVGQSLVELGRALRRARISMRRVKMDGMHAQIARDFQLHSEPCINTGEYA